MKETFFTIRKLTSMLLLGSLVSFCYGQENKCNEMIMSEEIALFSESDADSASVRDSLHDVPMLDIGYGRICYSDKTGAIDMIENDDGFLTYAVQS